jgi:hypothetical protein
MSKELIPGVLERELLVDLSHVHLKCIMKVPTLFLNLELSPATLSFVSDRANNCA